MSKDDDKPAKGEQLELLETDHPKEKEFLKLGRAIRRCDAERGEVQDKRDKYAETLIALFKSTKLKRFVKAEIDISLKEIEERVSVKGRKGTERRDDGED